MVKVDFDAAPETATPPGPHLCEVRRCAEKTSRKGDAMFKVNWRGLEDTSLGVFDYVMLQGGGAGMGYKKLEGLGWPRKFNGNIEASELVGKRAWLFLVVEEYQGKASLKVDISQGTHCGYQPEDDPPDAVEYAAPPKEDGDEEDWATPDQVPF